MRRFQAIAITAAALSALIGEGFVPAVAQQYGKNADPNLGHFYMARQQIQILDDAPQVNDYRTQPAPPAGAAPPGAAPAMNRPQPLPRAGFMPYSNSLPSVQNSLPKTFNGVPPKAPPMRPVNPAMGKAGAYKAGKKAAAVASAPAAPPTLKKYAPVNGYGGNAMGGPTTVVRSGGASASTAVRGSLMQQSGPSALHWSRTR